MKRLDTYINDFKGMIDDLFLTEDDANYLGVNIDTLYAYADMIIYDYDEPYINRKYKEEMLKITHNIRHRFGGENYNVIIQQYMNEMDKQIRKIKTDTACYAILNTTYYNEYYADDK